MGEPGQTTITSRNIDPDHFQTDPTNPTNRNTSQQGSQRHATDAVPNNVMICCFEMFSPGLWKKQLNLQLENSETKDKPTNKQTSKQTNRKQNKQTATTSHGVLSYKMTFNKAN